jgi:DNA-binding MarR family transcriptional regulator
MKKEVLIDVINLLDSFDSQIGNSPYTTADFVAYLKGKDEITPLEMRSVGGDQNEFLEQARKSANADPAILITFMYRYAKSYIKKAMGNSPIQTADEFSFLITLMTFESLTKTELISKQIVEKTSGIEVIKRLYKQGLLTEFNDPVDRRSVRVAITQLGREAILDLLPQMSAVSKIVVGNLSQSEIDTLTFLLKKLDYFHHDIFLNQKNWTLEKLLERLNNPV